GAEAFFRVADDCRRPTIANAGTKALQRSEDSAVGRGVYGVDLPSEGREDGFERRHGVQRAVVNVQLAMVAVHQHAEIVQIVLARVHRHFPAGTLLKLSIADHAIGIELRTGASRDGEALRHTDALTHR